MFYEHASARLRKNIYIKQMDGSQAIRELVLVILGSNIQVIECIYNFSSTSCPITSERPRNCCRKLTFIKWLPMTGELRKSSLILLIRSIFLVSARLFIVFGSWWNTTFVDFCFWTIYDSECVSRNNEKFFEWWVHDSGRNGKQFFIVDFAQICIKIAYGFFVYLRITWKIFFLFFS